MDAALKAKILEALRSGRYRKGEGLLRYIDIDNGQECHCTMGVIADVIDPDGWGPLDVIEPGRVVAELNDRYPHRECEQFPDRDLMRQAGLSDEEIEQIVMWNDVYIDTQEGKRYRTFEEIAELIDDWL